MTEGPETVRRVFNGRYEIVRHIARGGMAQVYLAHDLLLDRRVALKVLFPELSTDAAFVERFRREAQAAANLTHPNIVSIFDWGEEDGTYFIVMEYVEGRSLANLLRTEGPQPPRRAAEIGAAVAAALAAAHRGGVIHRDVKPGNVLIDRTGEVKVTDFGIARATDTPDDLTRTGAVLGTAAYFSPEQAQGFVVDARSDVYSLGVVLYEMVAGRPPFTGPTPVAIAYKHVREEPPPLAGPDTPVPRPYELIVQRALAKEPGERYGSAAELRADLLRFAQGRPVLATERPAPTQAVAATEVNRQIDATRALPVTGAEPETHHTGAYFALLLALIGVLAVLLFLLGQQLGFFDTGNQSAVVVVPSVIDRTVEDASTQLRQLGLGVDTQTEASDKPAGTVFAQSPEGGSKVHKGETVLLRVSTGPAPITVPRVIGENRQDAEDELRAAGFEPSVETREDDEQPEDTVLAQDPAGGTKAARGSTVVITVSSGKGKTTVPNVVGDDVDAAANELGRAGFATRRTTEHSATVASGKVIRTDPAGGTEAEKGATVTMVVSSGPEQVTVPDVVGLTEDDATSQLEALGFVVDVRRTPTTDSTENGKVLVQSPTGGTKADKGATVQIRVGQSITP